MTSSPFEFFAKQREEFQTCLRAAREKLGTSRQAAAILGVNQSTISRFENGKRLPNPRYISDLARIVGVSQVEEIRWYGLAGYLPTTRMPSLDRIIDGLELYCRDILKDNYPSIIVDYRFTIWAMNPVSYNTFGYEITKAAISNCITLLYMIYSDQPDFVDQVTNQREHTQQLQLTLFKAFNLNRRHEPFYKLYPDYMKEQLGGKTRGFKEFQQHWKTTNIADAADNPEINQASIEVSGFFNSNQSILFRERLAPTFHLPQFAIIRWEPHDQNNFSTYSDLPQFENYGVLKLWEITDPNPLLERYNHGNFI